MPKDLQIRMVSMQKFNSQNATRFRLQKAWELRGVLVHLMDRHTDNWYIFTLVGYLLHF